MGFEPGLSDVFTRYAADHLFATVDEIGVRDGADLVVDGYEFAPTFSIWTLLEECLNPPLVWERERGFFTLRPFRSPKRSSSPKGSVRSSASTSNTKKSC
jgi:saccharopine dehydrogenase (NAD+, L-lysine-forming)